MKKVQLVAGIGVALGALVIAGQSASAAPFTWDGSTNPWNTPASWGGTTPNANTTTEQINIGAGTVTWVPGGDFSLNTTLNISGTGTWAQTAGPAAWIKIGDGGGKTGTLNLSGNGVFNTVDSGQLIFGNTTSTGAGTGKLTVSGSASLTTKTLSLNSGATATVSGGSVNFQTLNMTNTTLNVSGGSFTKTTAGNMDVNGGNSVTVSGTGVFTVPGELKPKTVGVFNVSGGTVNANLLAFDGGGPAIVDFSGGRINLAAGGWQGIFSAGGDDYVNFIGSGGTLFISGLTAANTNTLFTTGRVRHAGVVGATDFQVTEVTGPTSGVEITLVPEPTSLATLILGGAFLLRRGRNQAAAGRSK